MFNKALAKKRQEWLSKPAHLELDFKPRYPESQRKQIEREMIRKGIVDSIVGSEDSRQIAIKKVNSSRTAKTKAGQTEFMEKLYPGKHAFTPLEVLRENFQASARKRGPNYVLTIGEALNAELERQSKVGQTNPYWALSNLYDYLVTGKGAVRVEMTLTEKKELQKELRRVGRNSGSQQLKLSPNTRLVYELLRALRPSPKKDTLTGKPNKRLSKQDANLVYGRAILATKEALKASEN
ncbi:MAG: hypothetical protein WCW44_01220 [archaeon]|jgi:hypothetical protein